MIELELTYLANPLPANLPDCPAKGELNNFSYFKVVI